VGEIAIPALESRQAASAETVDVSVVRLVYSTDVRLRTKKWYGKVNRLHLPRLEVASVQGTGNPAQMYVLNQKWFPKLPVTQTSM
jgi:hypothetical protein